MALCQQGDEAVAVGLLAEALADSPVEGCADVDATDPARAGDADPAADAAEASSLLRKVSK